MRKGRESAGSLQAQRLPRGPVTKGLKSGGVTAIPQGPSISIPDGAQTQMPVDASYGHLLYLTLSGTCTLPFLSHGWNKDSHAP